MFYFNRELFRGTVRNQGEHSMENWGIWPRRKGRMAGGRDGGWVGEGRWVGKGGWGEGWGGRGVGERMGRRRKGRQNLWVCEYFTFTIHIMGSWCNRR